ncbi:flagellar basal body P-ring formation chaperone FlgA [Halonatronum saccharophilum]|uniref:flagellar basal body P-ring formation chaperone FlgA n=1 Tax=Halonatronum saccharophilum TaxID=150060 RepID=UPI0004B49565|nr:flagellar basal body P-ring formation chaperone FlgA [Halonatronum saccharophilum]
MKIRFLIGFLMILVLFTNINVQAMESSIDISRQVRVRSLEITIGEVAEIDGSEEFKSKVSQISLGQSPLPGYQRTIYKDAVISALRSNDINPSNIKLNVPHQFNVITESREISVDSLIEVGREHIYDSLSYDKESINIEVLNPPSNLVIPYGDISLEVEGSVGRSLIGRNTIPIKVMIDDNVYRRIYLQYRVSVAKEVLVARDRIERGTKLSEGLFERSEVLIDSNNNQYLSPDQDLSGRRMRVSLESGRPLLERMVEIPPLVNRWSDIRIIARVGGIEISTTGRARQSGHLGEVIQVQNTDSGNTVEGRVVGEDTVEVLLN